MKSNAGLLCSIALLGAGCSLNLNGATLYTFDFGSPAGTLGLTQAYASGPGPLPAISIVLCGFSSTGAGAANKLFGKRHPGSDENGVGLNGFRNGEITRAGFVQIDLEPLPNAGTLTAFALMFGSVTGREGWMVYGTNTAGSLAGATNLKSGSANFGTFVNFSSIPAARYIDVIASGSGASNILLAQLQVSLDPARGGAQANPEPATFGLMGVALAGLGALRLRGGS